MAPYLPFDCPTRVTDRNGCPVSYVTPISELLRETAGWIVQCLRTRSQPTDPDPDDNKRQWEPPPYHF